MQISVCSFNELKILQFIRIKRSSTSSFDKFDNMEASQFQQREDETIYISSDGLQKLMSSYSPQFPGEGTMWTTDYNVELPIRMKKIGPGSQAPTTLIQEFTTSLELYGSQPALSKKVDGKWHTINYTEYYEECMTFGRSLIELHCYMNAVNIIGFNAPEWNISFFGSLFARCLPVGIYTTNTQQACHFIAEHSDCALVVAEDHVQVQKYIPLLKEKKLKYIVIYGEKSINYDTFEGRIMLWKDFMSLGKRVEKKTLIDRMKTIKPGNCCTLVYTSGTTGMPKAVMLSHDNYTWTKKSVDYRRVKEKEAHLTQKRLLSYLPLSHVAAQIQDVTGAMMEGGHVFFADPTALAGPALIKYLQEVKPHLFFSVPRVWEKIEEKMRDIARNNGWLATKISTWAKEQGKQGSILEFTQKPTTFSYKVAKFLIFNNIRRALGLDEAIYLIFGAAPLSPDIREYMLMLGMPLINGYGMSECSGPESMTDQFTLQNTKEFMREAGTAIPGTELKIFPLNPGDADGQICYRGRNVFMGYYKNPEETSKTIDRQGFLHSGDMGALNPDGVLFITGRLKELLITAAGENIPPVLIQNQIKEELPFVSNVMLIGDGKKFLTALVTLKAELDGSGKIPQTLIYYYEKAGSKAKTVPQAKGDPLIFKAVMQGVNRYNEKAISRAQKVQTITILEEDFSIENGLMTPTLKLKRKDALKRYSHLVDQMYRETKL